MQPIFDFVGSNQLVFFIALYVWQFIWKGLSLWRAAINKQRNWFIVLLVVNTAGILEIVYLFKFCKKPLTIKEIKSWFGRK